MPSKDARLEAKVSPPRAVTGFRSIDACGLTGRGRVRTGSEDHFLIGQLDKSMLVTATSLPGTPSRRMVGAPEGQVFCVADGLVRDASGGTADATAIEVAVQYLLHTMPCFFRARSLSEPDLRNELVAAVKRAQQAVMGRTVDGAATRGVGTLTLGFLQWPRLHLVHVGDGRCYLFRHGLQQLTTDHTLLQQLVDEGRLPMRTNEKTPLGQPTRNEIGAAADQFVDVSKVEMRPGDTLMLCTDGLVHDLHDADIGAILGGNEPAAAMVRNLVEAADARDGTDGFTVIVARMPSAVDPGEQHEVRLAQDPPDEGAGSPS